MPNQHWTSNFSQSCLTSVFHSHQPANAERITKLDKCLTLTTWRGQFIRLFWSLARKTEWPMTIAASQIRSLSRSTNTILLWWLPTDVVVCSLVKESFIHLWRWDFPAVFCRSTSTFPKALFSFTLLVLLGCSDICDSSVLVVFRVYSIPNKCACVYVMCVPSFGVDSCHYTFSPLYVRTTTVDLMLMWRCLFLATGAAATQRQMWGSRQNPKKKTNCLSASLTYNIYLFVVWYVYTGSGWLTANDSLSFSLSLFHSQPNTIKKDAMRRDTDEKFCIQRVHSRYILFQSLVLSYIMAEYLCQLKLTHYLYCCLCCANVRADVACAPWRSICKFSTEYAWICHGVVMNSTAAF